MPGCVVSDTSPLSAMAKMDWLLWLKERWGTVHVPHGVWVELEQIGDEEAWHRLESARGQGWLVVIPERPVRTLPVFGNLHRGEIEAISLALDLDAGWLVVDDGDARKAAKSLGLRIIGLLGMVVWAKKQGKFPSAIQHIENLRRVTRFRISAQVMAQIAIDLDEA